MATVPVMAPVQAPGLSGELYLYCQKRVRYCTAFADEIMTPAKTEDTSTPLRETRGLLFGLCGVAGFSATLPATRVAVAHLDPLLVGLGRSVVAGILAALLLWATRQPFPQRSQFKSLALAAACVIVGFPLLSSWAMVNLPAAHAAIMIGVIPLLTAAASALRSGERPSTGFWLTGLAGAALIIGYAFAGGAAHMQLADAALLGAALVVAVGYAEGGRLAQSLGGWQTICWALVLAAPFLVLPVLYAGLRHGLAAPLQSWLGFAYVAVVSQLLAFFLWYQGLALGGVARVSQVQLLQPFMTLGVAALLLGEPVTPSMLAFAVAVAAVVGIGRRMPIYTPEKHP
ncbi:MAG: DMT family transporter [Sulfuricella sp.]|nr:DMT family transporter [Sulfuricella sp.]